MSGFSDGQVGIEPLKRRTIEDLLANLPISNAGDDMGESSVVIVKMPSNFRSTNGWVTSAEMRARTLHEGQRLELDLSGATEIPCLSQAYVCDTILISKGEADTAECIKGPAINPDIFA